jgi:hypothetical protein
MGQSRRPADRNAEAPALTEAVSKSHPGSCY